MNAKQLQNEWFKQDQKRQAHWIAENLTAAQRKMLAKIATHPEPIREVLGRSLLEAFVLDRTRAVNKAIDRGDCAAEQYVDTRTQKRRAELAELVANHVRHYWED